MFKRTLAIISLFTGSISLAFASYISFPPFFSGTSFLGGGTIFAGTILAYQSISANNIRFEAFSPRFSLGYRRILSTPLIFGIDVPLFFGIEGFIGHTIGTVVNHKNLQNYSFRNVYSYGFSITPGVILDYQILGYLRAGAIGTQFKHNSLNRWGYQFGAGVEASVFSCWNVRGEYDYNMYRKISGAGAPKEDQYSVAVIYKFGCSGISVC